MKDHICLPEGKDRVSDGTQRVGERFVAEYLGIILATVRRWRLEGKAVPIEYFVHVENMELVNLS